MADTNIALKEDAAAEQEQLYSSESVCLCWPFLRYSTRITPATDVQRSQGLRSLLRDYKRFTVMVGTYITT